MFLDMKHFLTIFHGQITRKLFLKKSCLDKISGLFDVIQHNKIHIDVINKKNLRNHEKEKNYLFKIILF